MLTLCQSIYGLLDTIDWEGWWKGDYLAWAGALFAGRVVLDIAARHQFGHRSLSNGNRHCHSSVILHIHTFIESYRINVIKNQINSA